jgi:hypothetical protein
VKFELCALFPEKFELCVLFPEKLKKTKKDVSIYRPGGSTRVYTDMHTDHLIAVLMATHPRLGAASPLPAELLANIAQSIHAEEMEEMRLELSALRVEINELRRVLYGSSSV